MADFRLRGETVRILENVNKNMNKCILHINLYQIQRFFGDIVLFTWQLYSKFSYFGDFIDDVTGRISGVT